MSALALDIVSWAAAGLAVAGTIQAVAGNVLLRRFLAAPGRTDRVLPPVTLLKPLHGEEPLLEEALASFCEQDHPAVQIVFGVQDEADPAIGVVERLRARYPDIDMTLVIDPTPHGANRKVDNLINMLPHCRHGLLVISDADIHAPPNLVREVVAPLGDPAVGLTTTLYTGRSASTHLCRRLGAAQINQMFLPGALIGRALGRRDCMGAVMALSAATLERAGGFEALSPHLADDAVLGRRVRALELGVQLAHVVPATSVVEPSLRELFLHELRWGRTVRSQAPIGYPMSLLQTPIVWAAFALAASGATSWSLAVFGLVWTIRHLVGRDVERRLGLGQSSPFWLAPLRDAFSFAIVLASHVGGTVAWRGRTLHVSADRNLEVAARPVERLAPRPTNLPTPGLASGLPLTARPYALRPAHVRLWKRSA